MDQGIINRKPAETALGGSKNRYEILENVEFPWPLAEMVYRHHERMDGSSYPRGLKGADIPKERYSLVLRAILFKE